MSEVAAALTSVWGPIRAGYLLSPLNVADRGPTNFKGHLCGRRQPPSPLLAQFSRSFSLKRNA